MEVKATKEISEKTPLVAVVFDVKDVKNHPFFKSINKDDKKYVEAALKGEKLGDGATKIFHLPSDPKRVFLVFGLGAKSDWNRRKFFLAGRKVVASLKANRIENAILNLDDFSLRNSDAAETAKYLVQNLLMADFAYVEHKEKPKEDWPKIKSVELYARLSKKLEKAMKDGEIIGNAVNSCRHISNTPGGIMTPEKLANEARKVAKETAGVKVKVLEEAEIKKLKMGGVLGVSAGSSEKPHFIILEYGPAKKKPIVFVGKGITFDTGGLNIKPSQGMLEMHMDMSGGAAVIHAIEAIAKLKLPVHVIGLVPAVENMPSGSSYRPGDLLKTITGKTIEVLNTDAEGRVVLADALGYAQRYEPALVVDIATLTGAAVGALGQRMSAVFANQEKLLNFAKRAGGITGDYAWPMPLWDEYDEDIKATFGDVANVGKTKYGGAITAAAFLKQFIGDYPWIHLDIAPTMTSIEGQYLEKGAAGAGVRFLIEIAKSFSPR